MYSMGDRISVKTDGAGRFFDLMDVGHLRLITDYQRLDREIISGTNGGICLGGSLTRKEINSIAELRAAFEEIISAVIQILNQVNELSGLNQLDTLDELDEPNNLDEIITATKIPVFITDGNDGWFSPTRFTFPAFDLNNSEKKLLVEQLVFDILFDKYLDESEQMTRSGYATIMAKKLYTDLNQINDCARSINENLTRGMKLHYNMMKHSSLRKQLEMLWIDPDKYGEYYNPKMRENSKRKKPKFIWDYFYYNFGRNLKSPASDNDDHPNSKRGRDTITSKQYKRQFTKESRNYPYQEIIEDLKSYNALVSKLLPTENAHYKKYFHMSMDYYVLESYKRIDFMLKLISFLSPAKINEIDKEHFLVKRFHPLVLVPYVANGELCYGAKYNYYRPLFIVEDELLKEIQKDDAPDSKYGIKLQRYHIIRAKAYELFKYHGKFNLTSYEDIEVFLQQSYNMRQYHESTEIWKTITDGEWDKMDKRTKQRITKQLQQLLLFNEAFFWKSSDRVPNIPKDKTQ